MQTPLRLLAAGVALAALAACSDSTGFSGDQLTTDEAALLTDDMVATALDGVNAEFIALNFNVAGPAASAAAVVDFTHTMTRTVDCPAGGTRALAGSMSGTRDSDTHSGTIHVEKTLTLTDCARLHGDVTITVNTDPPLTFQGTITIENGVRSGEFSKTGTFHWETSNGRSGSCEVNLSIVYNADHTGSVTGTVCGRDVNRQFDRNSDG